MSSPSLYCGISDKTTGKVCRDLMEYQGKVLCADNIGFSEGDGGSHKKKGGKGKGKGQDMF
jgi:hypothetical protein